MNQSIIEHRANYYYVEFREDFLQICLACAYKKPDTAKSKCKASAYCKALILAIMEGWTNHKRGGDLFVSMSYSQWTLGMYGMFGRNVIIDSLDELLGEGLLSREAHKVQGKDTYKYLLNHAEVNRRMRELPERHPQMTHPIVNAFTSKPVTDLQVNGSSINPSTSKSNAFTSKPDTHLLVNDTSLQVNEDPFTKGHFIDTDVSSTQHLNKETNIIIGTPPPASASSLGKKKSDLLSLASAEVQALVAEWKVCHKAFCDETGTNAKVVVNKTLIDHATTLINQYGLLPGSLAGLIERMRAKDRKGWYVKNGLHLGNVVNEAEKTTPVKDILPDDAPQSGMSRAEFDEVGIDMQSIGLHLLCAQDAGTGLYFIGIADSDTSQIDINRPNDWYHLPMEQLTRALAYAHLQRTA